MRNLSKIFLGSLVALLIVVEVAMAFALSFLAVAGMLALWIQIWGEPQSFWMLAVCIWVISCITCTVSYYSRRK